MKPHRIFIAINLPENVKTKLLAYQKKWPELPARWVSKENLHLTLVFLGNTSDAELQTLIDICRGVAARHAPLELKITQLRYGPETKRPRMIWALLEKSEALAALQQDLEQGIANSDHGHYRPETPSTSPKARRPYAPHLTLARLNAFQLRQLQTEEPPDINESLSITFDVHSLDIMESKLKRSGAEYIILQSFMLQQE